MYFQSEKQESISRQHISERYCMENLLKCFDFELHLLGSGQGFNNFFVLLVLKFIFDFERLIDKANNLVG